MPLWSQLEIIDWQQSLERAAHDKRLAYELLGLLYDAIVDAKKQFEQAYAEQNPRLVRDDVHTLKGSVMFCGVPQLQMTLKTLNNQFKQTPNDNTKLLLMIRETIDSMSNFLECYTQFNIP